MYSWILMCSMSSMVLCVELDLPVVCLLQKYIVSPVFKASKSSVSMEKTILPSRDIGTTLVAESVVDSNVTTEILTNANIVYL
ncbi:hypothetical protein ACS0TY_021578 [Phlomoides rotata]